MGRPRDGVREGYLLNLSPTQAKALEWATLGMACGKVTCSICPPLKQKRLSGPLLGRLLLGVQDGLEQEQADGGENYVISEEHLDPEGWVGVSAEDGGDGQHHGQQRGHENGKQDQRQKHFAVARADGERGEERSVDEDSPGAERHGEEQHPDVAERAQVVKDGEQRSQQQLDCADEEKVGEDFAEKKRRRQGPGSCGVRRARCCATPAPMPG